MINTNITNFRKNMFEMLGNTIKYNEVINVSTKEGNAVILSEEDYKGMTETIYLSSIPGLKDEILRRAAEPIEDSLSEDNVEW
jgi:Phd_YefM.